MAIDRVGRIHVTDGDEFSRGTTAVLEVQLTQPRLADEMRGLEESIAEKFLADFPDTNVLPSLDLVRADNTDEASNRVRVTINHDYWAPQHRGGRDIGKMALIRATRTALDVIDTETRSAEGQRRRWGKTLWQVYNTGKSKISYSYPWHDARAKTSDTNR